MKKLNSLLNPDYDSAAIAVNFREICVGKIAPNTLFRSSHPIIDNKQEPSISLLASNARIASVINLSDSNYQLKTKAFFSPWYYGLYKSNRIIGLGINFTDSSESYGKKLKKGLQFMIGTPSPLLIHCHAGVDRTGFACMVLEALMGATMDEIADDYLKSYNSIFSSSIYGGSKGDSLIVMQLLSAMGGSLATSDQNLQGIAEHYLQNTIKLSPPEIELLKSKLSA